jgi:LysM repeat protein
MKMTVMAGSLITLGAAVLLVCGCASPKVQNTEVPKGPEETQVVKAEEPVQAAPVEQKYTVQAGDTLWAISDKAGIYSDSYQWPLIFKADRDQIQDPDQIVPGQILIISQGPTAQQVAHARQLASDTPAFVKHEEPRKTLPLNYF